MGTRLHEKKTDFCDDLHFCNYPEISKTLKCWLLDEDDNTSYDSSSSSGLPSCTSAVSDTQSYKGVIRCDDASSSLWNLQKSSLSTEDITDDSDGSSTSVESSDKEELNEENQLEGGSYPHSSMHLDPEGWIKYASDPDPWNEKFYSQIASEKFSIRDGILTHEQISGRTSNLIQLPDTKEFVFSRLHINKMDLENIFALSIYRYFLYIDMSWNLITDLNGLNQCNYLMYLNASHNKIKKVLDFQPPWFLTHANLCCNEIKEIGTGNLSEFWSLSYLDLSYNRIEKIEGLQDLRYLKHLNLSHNYIQQIENLHCTSLQELNLSFNRITGFNQEDNSFQILEDLIELNLAHNCLTSLLHLENLKSLKKLDVSENKVSDFYEMHRFDGLKKLKELDMTGNDVCSSQGYREFLIFKLPSLEIIDFVPVEHQERVATRMLWEPDIFTRKTHLRTLMELWKQLATQTIDVATVSYDDAPIPLVVLVGTFGSNKKEIAKTLGLTFPDQLYRCKQVTTIPVQSICDADDFFTLSVDSFNNLIKDGKLLFYYQEIGGLFGVGVDQLSKCVVEDKIGIIETTLEGALMLRNTGSRPYLILCAMKDTNSYEEKLSIFFSESNLWTRFYSSDVRKMSSVYLEDPVENEEESLNQTEYSVSSSIAPERNRLNSTLASFMSYQSNLFSERNMRWQKRFAPRESQLSDKKAITKPQDAVSCDDDFEWEWTYDPSVIIEVEPSESYQNMVRGREVFLRNMLEQQDMYIEMNNSHPSLFRATVYSDDVEKAVKQIGRTCCDIYNNRRKLIKSETVLDQQICNMFIGERVQSLMEDLVNVNSGV